MGCHRGVFRVNRTTTKQPSAYRGLILAVLSGISYSIVAMIVKQMRSVHPGQIALYRFVATLVMFLPQTVKSRQNLLGPRQFRVLLIFRGIFGALTIFLNFVAFQYLGLAEASVIIFSSPAFVTISARLLFKEPCNFFQSVTVVLTIIGIIFTTKLPSRLTDMPFVYSTEKIYGLLAAIFSLFSATALMLATRKTRTVHQSIVNFSYSWIGVVEIGIVMAIFGNFQWPQCGIGRIYILLIALFSYSGIIMLVKALQFEYAGIVSTVRSSTDIMMAIMWQIFIFHDVPDFYSIVGVVLVTVSIILIGFSKWLTNLKGNLFSCEKFKCFSN